MLPSLSMRSRTNSSNLTRDSSSIPPPMLHTRQKMKSFDTPEDETSSSSASSGGAFGPSDAASRSRPERGSSDSKSDVRATTSCMSTVGTISLQPCRTNMSAGGTHESKSESTCAREASSHCGPPSALAIHESTMGRQPSESSA